MFISREVGGGLLKSTLIWQEIVHIWYTPKACKYWYTLKVAINEGVGQGRHPVPQDCRVAPLHQNPQSPPEVPNCLTFLLASVTGIVGKSVFASGILFFEAEFS